MIALSVVSLIVSILALGGVWYTRKEVNLIIGESREKKTWATKHAEARRLVLQTHRWITTRTGQTEGFQLVFADRSFRMLVETYIVEMDWTTNRMSPRALDTDQLLLPTVQEVIQQSIDTVERFKREHPEESATLGL